MTLLLTFLVNLILLTSVASIAWFMLREQFGDRMPSLQFQVRFARRAHRGVEAHRRIEWARHSH